MALGLAVALAAPSALAKDDKKAKKKAAAAAVANPAQAALGGGGVKVPWRGSFVTLSNTTSARQLDKGADQTWNPINITSLNISPRYWFGNKTFLRGGLTLSYEATEADDQTYANEVRFSDTTVGVGGILPMIPGVGVLPIAFVDARLPTSKLSRHQGLNVGAQGGLVLMKNVNVLSGLTLTYFFGGRKFFQDYTTSGLRRPAIPGSGNPVPGFGAAGNDFMNSGVRNTSWQFLHAGSVWVGLTSWLNASVAVTTVQNVLYDLPDNPPGVVDPVIEGQDSRYFINYTVSLGFQPTPAVGIGLSADTFNPQLDPTSGEAYRTPFFNRFTNIVAELRLNVGAL